MNEGWLKIFGEDSYHYFVQDKESSCGKSLCGKVIIFTIALNADQDHTAYGNCSACFDLLPASKIRKKDYDIRN